MLSEGDTGEDITRRMSTAQLLERELASIVRSHRQQSGLTQAALARKMKTKQPSIARSERNGFTVALAEKTLAAMGQRLGFNHISVGTIQNHSFYFLGGILYQDELKAKL